MMAPTVFTRALRPSRSVGGDGIPDYVTAVRGSPRYWRPRSGYRLDVTCNTVPLRYVIEADRAKGWVLCKKMFENADGSFTEITGKQIFYQGVVEYRVTKVSDGH